MSEKIEIILEAIKKIDKDRIIIGIDGRCAAGKTYLAAELQKILDCNVFHTDDFFLNSEQRTSDRYAEPDGNMDRERFLSEVIEPLGITPKKINIIEGSYCCQERLRDYYDLRIFLNVPHKTQLERLFERDGSGVVSYIDKWIPLEERYFKECEIEKHCDISL